MALKNILPTQDPNRGQFSVWGLKEGVFLVGEGPVLGQAESNNEIKFKSISLSNDNQAAIGIKQDGTLWAWGEKPSIAKVNRWVDIKAGQDHYAALDINGNLYVAGSDEYGQLGLNNARASINVANVTSVDQATFVIRTDGTVQAWGNNAYGITGLQDNSLVSHENPGQLPGSWISIAAGDFHSVGIKSDGTLWTWGYNNSGQLGTSQINTWTAASRPSAGEFFHLISTDGSLWGVGVNTRGQVGVGVANSFISFPTLISSGNWTAVGGAYLGVSSFPIVLALAANNDLYAWGYAPVGASRTFVYRSSPVFLASNVTSFDLQGDYNLGSKYKLAYVSNNELYMYGTNESGSLGAYYNSGNVALLLAGKNMAVWQVDNDDGISNYTINFSGTDTHGIYALGANNHGFPRVYNSGYSTALDSTFIGYTSRLSLNDTIYFRTSPWNGYAPRGNNLYGQHGTGSLDGNYLTSFNSFGASNTSYSLNNPPGGFLYENIPDSLDAIDLAPGLNGALLIANNYTLWGWGRNQHGQFTNQINTQSWTAISEGYTHILALTSSGAVYTWLNAIGQNTANNTYKEAVLGRNEGDQYPHPVKFSNGIPLSGTLISAGGNHNMVLGTDSKIYSWGINTSGQLGTGSTSSYENRPVSLTLQPSGTVTYIHAGSESDSYCIANSILYYWGQGDQYFQTPPAYYYGGGGG